MAKSLLEDKMNLPTLSIVILFIISSSAQVQRTADDCISEKFFRFNPDHTGCLRRSPQAAFTGVSENNSRLIVNIHNNLRARQNATNMQKMVWDTELASLAQKYAESCISLAPEKNGSVPGRFPTGMSSALRNPEKWNNVIRDTWYDIDGFDDDEIGWQLNHEYLRIIWATSSRVGCGYAKCNFNLGGYYFCNYGPAKYGAPGDAFISGTRCAACPSKCNEGLCDCEGKTCFNGGTIDVNTCKCSCTKPWHSPEICEVDCSKVVESDDCREGGRHFGKCLTSLQAQYDCPLTCNICERRDCGNKVCDNGGILNTYSCECNCRLEWTDGPTCGLYCPAVQEPEKCDEGGIYYGQCLTSPEARYHCPLRCGMCNITVNCATVVELGECGPGGRYFQRCPASAQTQTYCPITCGTCEILNCGGKTCGNRGTLNIYSCECKCFHQWNFGENCERNCSAVVEPDDCREGGRYFGQCRTSIQAKYDCPLTCGVCQPAGQLQLETMSETPNVNENYIVSNVRLTRKEQSYPSHINVSCHTQGGSLWYNVKPKLYLLKDLQTDDSVNYDLIFKHSSPLFFISTRYMLKITTLFCLTTCSTADEKVELPEHFNIDLPVLDKPLGPVHLVFNVEEATGSSKSLQIFWTASRITSQDFFQVELCHGVVSCVTHLDNKYIPIHSTEVFEYNATFVISESGEFYGQVLPSVGGVEGDGKSFGFVIENEEVPDNNEEDEEADTDGDENVNEDDNNNEDDNVNEDDNNNEDDSNNEDGNNNEDDNVDEDDNNIEGELEEVDNSEASSAKPIGDVSPLLLLFACMVACHSDFTNYFCSQWLTIVYKLPQFY